MTTGDRQAYLEAKIETLKQDLLTLGELRPGTLSEQYNVCGKAGCACKADPPRKHGPYYQVSFTWQGRSHTQFVRQENVATTRQQLRNYERLRAVVEAWVAAGLELAALRFGTAPVRPPRAPQSGPSSHDAREIPMKWRQGHRGQHRVLRRNPLTYRTILSFDTETS
jgi:hypothetical protein